MKIEDFYQLDNFHVDELDTAGRPIVAKLSVVEEALMLKLDAAVTTAKESFGNEAGRFHVHCIVLGRSQAGQPTRAWPGSRRTFRRLGLVPVGHGRAESRVHRYRVLSVVEQPRDYISISGNRTTSARGPVCIKASTNMSLTCLRTGCLCMRIRDAS